MSTIVSLGAAPGAASTTISAAIDKFGRNKDCGVKVRFIARARDHFYEPELAALSGGRAAQARRSLQWRTVHRPSGSR
jgi:hypothetical protein